MLKRYISLQPPLPLVLQPSEKTAQTTRRDPLISFCFWLAVALYTLTFLLLSLRRYDAFMMHALDMGNMEQAIWNTFNGHPFRFTNMRAHLKIEAFGTDTRLSFHVEPILLPISLLQILHAGPPALLTLQTIVLASGAIPVRALARRHLAPSRLAELAFPLAYLLFPALQAANLYEFHPVTLTAALLLWALDFADQQRALPFVLTCIAAVSCKEEIGVVVALLALWSMRRGVSRRVAGLLALACFSWSLIAVLVIVPMAQHAQHSAVASSPYLSRYVAAGALKPGQYEHVTALDVLRYWMRHPEQVIDSVIGPAKRSYLQRLLAPAGYLSLLSPQILLIMLPSLLLILLSNDPHMYGGVGHYSAELVPMVVAAAVFGLSWAATIAERRDLRRCRVIRAGCLFLLVLSLANCRVNGFSPLSTAFEWPALTAHTALTQQMLALIPPTAAVSAQDTLDPHLSDRAQIYLFPDYDGAEYIALDVTADAIPSKPSTLERTVVALLASRQWDIAFANDGLLLLHHRHTARSTVPRLPERFYSFATSRTPALAHTLQASVGQGLELLGYTLTRKDIVNLRIPDVVITTYWRITKPQQQPLSILTAMAVVGETVPRLNGEQTVAPWLPTTSWKVGEVIAMSSTGNGISVDHTATLQACISVVPGIQLGEEPGTGLPFSIADAATRAGSYRLLFGGRVLCFGAIPAVP